MYRCFLFVISSMLWCFLVRGASKKDTVYINQLIQQAKELQSVDPDSALLVARSVFKLSEKIKYQKGIGTACLRIGAILNEKGQNDSAMFYAKRAYGIRTELNDYRGATSACFTLYHIYRETGKIDSAFAALYGALRLTSQSKNQEDLISTYTELGNLNVAYKNGIGALKYYRNAEKLALELGEPNILMPVYSGLGTYFFSGITGKYREALHYFLKVDSLCVVIADRISQAQTANNIALCLEQLGEYQKAKTYYQKALQVYRMYELKNEEANTCFNLGSMFNNRHMPDSAIYYLNMAIPLARETQDLKKLANCFEYLSDAYALKRDFEQAYAMHVQSSELNDSLLNSEKVTAIAEMQTLYETEKKEEQILFLNEQAIRRGTQRNALIFGAVGLLVFLIVVIRQRNKVNIQKKLSDDLLLNILPAEVAQELKDTGGSEARQYNNVTVLFTDFVNFTGISEQMSPRELVSEIHRNFTAFDSIIEKHGLEKIKTIGDAYLAVCGLPHETIDHAQRVVNAALEIRDYMNQNKGRFMIRIGVNSGAVVAGIVGVKKYAYDIWGDTVNLAARMEQNSEPGKVNISNNSYALVKDHFHCTPRLQQEVKGKGRLDMYFVEWKEG